MNRTISEAGDRALANALPQIIWTCDAQGRLEWVNDRWTELTGLGEEESLRDKGALRAVHPDDHAEIARRFGEAVATGNPCEMEYRIRTREGDYRFHLCRVAPVRDAAGAIARWVAAAFDIHERRLAEQALRQSEARFEALFHRNPQPAAIKRLSDGRFLLVNDAFLKMSGYARESIVGKSTVELGFLSGEQRREIVNRLDDCGTTEFEVLFSNTDGRRLTVTVLSSPIDFDGERCVVNLVVDVTARHTAEQALRESEAQARARADELAGLMDAVPAAVWIARDPECREIHANRAGRDVLHLPEAAKNMSKTGPDPTPTWHFKVFANGNEVEPSELPLQRAARGLEVRNHEEEIRFDDGQVTHLYGSAIPLRDQSGAPRGSIGAFVDVTRLKQAEAALLEADRRKDDFLALLSHELRNPLAPILSAAQLMQFRGDVAAPEEREVIVRQAQHLVRLVDDLLDVSRVSRGKVTLVKQPIELATAVTKAIEGTMPLVRQRRHQLRLAVPAAGLLVDADEVRLTQVIANLLINAARYTEPGGYIEVDAAREGEEVVLQVRDNGTGIDPALLPHVFEMFVQGARGSDRAKGGLGLGLALVQTLTALHGGTATAHSDGRGRGSAFTVRLPASREPAPPPVPKRPAPRRAFARGHRVLVVDDNRDGAQMISGLLREAGYEVRTAGDGSEALSVVRDFRPRVAILDVGLPVMDGYTLGRELRALLGTAAPVLIALTGYGQEQDRRRSAEAGFTLHLVKPVDAVRLNRLVDALVGAGA